MEEAIRKDGFSSSALNLFTVQYRGPVLSQKSFCRSFCKKNLFSVFVSEQKGEGGSDGVLIVTPMSPSVPGLGFGSALRSFSHLEMGLAIPRASCPGSRAFQPGVTLVRAEGLVSCLGHRCHTKDSALCSQIPVRRCGAVLCPKCHTRDSALSSQLPPRRCGAVLCPKCHTKDSALCLQLPVRRCGAVLCPK